MAVLIDAVRAVACFLSFITEPIASETIGSSRPTIGAGMNFSCGIWVKKGDVVTFFRLSVQDSDNRQPEAPQYPLRGDLPALPENLRYHLATPLGIHESELRETAQDIAIPDAVFLPWLDIDISADHGSISDDLAEAGDSWVFDRQFLQQISHADISVLRMLSVKGDSM